MILPIRFSAEAASELASAAAWYDDRQPGLGAAFIDAVDAALGYVAEWPLLGATVPGLPDAAGVRRVPVARFPYHLPYLVLDDHLRVIAVAHDHRRPGYWAPRAEQ